MAAPFTPAVSDRRPPEERPTSVSGKTYPMTQHGFARDHRFTWLQREPNLCQLVLYDELDTSSRYPFAFRLEVTYAVSGAELEVTLRIDNFGDDVLPASIGAHPAFNWPLSPELAKDEYTLTFSDDEIAPIRRLKEGLMRATPEPLRSTARRWRCPNGCLTMMRSFWTCWRVHRSAIRGRADRRLNCPGRISRAWNLVKARRSAVPLHRTVARFCQSHRLRRRIRRQAGADAHLASGTAGASVSHTRRLTRKGRASVHWAWPWSISRRSRAGPAIELRALVSARSAPRSWGLR